MRMKEAVATFEAAKRQAVNTSTWRLRLRVKRYRRRIRRRPTEIDQLRLTAIEGVLRNRLGTTPLGQYRAA